MTLTEIFYFQHTCSIFLKYRVLYMILPSSFAYSLVAINSMNLVET